MMKKEMEKEDMLEDTYGAEEIRWSSTENKKKRWTLTEDEDEDHMEDSSSSSHKEEREEEHVQSFQEGTNK